MTPTSRAASQYWLYLNTGLSLVTNEFPLAKIKWAFRSEMQYSIAGRCKSDINRVVVTESYGFYVNTLKAWVPREYLLGQLIHARVEPCSGSSHPEQLKCDEGEEELMLFAPR